MNNDEVSLENLHFGHVDEYQIIWVDQTKGKTVDPEKGISVDHWTGQAVIHFDDGKFIVLKIETDYDDHQIGIMRTRPYPQDLKYLDLITEEEYDDYLADKKSYDNATGKKRRLKQYELLKKEFENG